MASDWKNDPTKCQQELYEVFSRSDYDKYEPETTEGKIILLRKVGYAIFSVPDEEPSCNNGYTGYSKNKYETIRNVSEAIVDTNNQKKNGQKGTKTQKELRMAIVFVFVKYNDSLLQYPVFRILLPEQGSDYQFVDSECRIYQTWGNFLTENCLPPGKFCWPKGGIYSADQSGKVNLDWGITPAATDEHKALQELDSASSWIGVRASAVLLGSLFFPVWGPVVTAASVCAGGVGIYSTLRSAGSLMDRAAHGQTVNPLRERQVASSWICTVGGAAALGGGYMMNKAATMAANGQVMGTASRFICNALNVTSLATNATGIGLGAFCVLERKEQGQLTKLEVFQLMSSVLFFSHSLVSFKTASTIIEDTQNSVIQDYESSLRSNRHRKEFKKLAKRTIADGETPVDGNAKIIRSIRNIDNKDDFFAGLVRTRKDLKGHKTVFSENGNIIVNDGAEIHPMKLYDLGKRQRQDFLAMAKDAAKNNTYESKTISYLSSTNDHKLSLDQILPSNNVVSEAVNVLWSQLKQMYPDRLITLSETMLVVHTVNELTTITCPYTNKNYARWWNLIWRRVTSVIKTFITDFEEGLTKAKSVAKCFDEKSYNKSQGIHDLGVFVHFVFKTYESLKSIIVQLAEDIEKELKKNSS